MEVDLLQVPYESGRRGVRMGAGPLRLVESGLVDHLAGLGHDVRLVPVEYESEFPTEIAAAFELARKIRDKVTESREERRLPVVLAGNCISAVGTMAALPADLYGSGPRWVRICRTTTTRPLTEQRHHCSHQHKPNKRRSMRSEMTPNLKERPDHLTLEKHMKANAAGLYKAWTEHFDLWFAQPGELIMAPEIDKPFFFYNRHDWGRNAHYGRFLELEQDRLIEMTWLTGKGGTFGAETVIRIELIPQDQGTMVRMTHSGFDDEKAAKAHKDNWPLALDELDRKLTT